MGMARLANSFEGGFGALVLIAWLAISIVGVPRDIFASNLPDAPVLTQTSADTVTVIRNGLDGAEITHFRVVDTEGIDLFQNDGVTALLIGDFFTAAEGTAGLKFASITGAAESSLTIVASLSDTADGTGLASTMIDLSPGGGVPQFEIRRPVYTVWEGARLPINTSGGNVPAMIFEIVKTGGGTGSWSVDVEVLQDVSDGDDAQADDGDPQFQEDFRIPAPNVSTVVFSGAESRKGFYVELVDETVEEQNQRFTVRITNPQIVSGSDIPTLGDQDSAKVVIVDNDLVQPDLTPVLPSPAPPATGGISVTTVPGVAGGQWRIVGESTWRNSASSVAGLAAGVYGVQFKPVPGYDAPSAVTVDVVEGATTNHSATYAANVSQETGSLLVNLTGPAEARWRRVGEEAWRQGGFTEMGVIAGDWVVEFQFVSGFANPGPRLISVENGVTSNLSAVYVSETAFGTQPAVVTPSVAQNTEPYLYLGQIETPLGNGTGTVVSDKVVLTAAHVLFDDGAYTYQGNVKWRFQRYAGSYEPSQQIPRGWQIFDGGYSAAFASQKRVEATPGISSLRAHDLDIAAMYFLESAGRGGKSGYLVSNETASNPWLTDAGKNRLLAGYPLDGISTTNQGKLSVAGPQSTFQFTHAFGKIFTSTDLQSYPGNSGGPLCVEHTPGNGNYFPAAIYVGGTGETRVRAIDHLVANLIGNAENAANGVGDNQGGGVTTSGPVDITLTSTSIQENNASGNVVGILGAIDPDLNAGEVFTFAVVGGLDAGQFEVVGDELRTTGGGLDLEAKQFHEVIVRVTDSGSNLLEETFMIEALDDAGEDFDGDGLTQTEEAALGTSDLISDWDGDGSGDGAEVAAGTDPLDPSEFADGTVFGWGDNELGQIAVPGDLWGVVEVSSIWNHSLALKSDGTVVGWGVDDYGQITIPAGLSDVVEVATGGYHSLAVKSDGTVVTWGRMLSGTLDVPTGLSDVLDVAAGFSDLSMALKSDGTVVAWGGNAYGRTTVPTGLDNVVEIAAGTHHCLALKSDGTVVAWGRDNNGQATVPPGLDDAVSIAAGLNHSLALRSNGTVVAWGWDTYQQSTVPAGLDDVVAIGAGYAHSFALKSDGTLVGWGNFNPGKMEPPPEVVGPERFAGGLGHGLAVLSMSDAPILLEDSMIVAPFNQPHSYQVAASGNNLEFSAMNLPVGLSIDSATGIISGTATEQGFGYARIAVQNGAGRDVKILPVNVGSGDAPTDITLNSNAIEENNASGNVVGTLGAIDPDVGDTFTFAVVGGLDAGQFEAVGDELRTTGGGLDLEAKQFHEVILRVTDSGNYVFEETFMIEALDDAGEDFDGDGLTQTEEAALGTSDLISDWDGDGSGDGAEVAAGTDPLDPSEFADGTVFGWGDNELGQIAVPGDLWGVVEVSSIWNHSLALKSDGTVVGWGVDDYGQITIPAGLSDVVEVATGGYHSLAVKSDGTVVTWGRMLSGTLDVPAGLSDVLDVAAGFSDLSMALKSDGTVVAWGGNAYGRTTVPTGLDNVVEIAAGTHHCLALKSDGTVVAWGRDNNGQATVPPGLDDAVSIAAGLNHSLALRSNGTVVAWGWDTYQQSTVPAGLDDVVAIGAGYAHSFALKSDGTLVGWGNFNPGKMEPPPEVVGPERFAGGLGHGLAVLSMSDAPILLEDSMIVAPFNQPHSYQVAASGNNLEFSAMNLPVGLSIDSATGIISGTATEQGFGYARIAVQNGAGRDVKILPVNVGSGDAPTDITLNSNAIEENNASGNVVGTLGAIDPDVGDTFTFAVVGGLDAGQFEAVGDELRTTGGGLDLEAKQFHEVILRVTDSGNYVFEETFMIEALDDAGEDFDGDGLTQTEEAALGTSDLISDWDGDGSGDGAEVAAGTDPLDPSEFADGTVFGWGDNELGQIAVPGDLWGVVEVSSIWNHSLALKSDGTVVGWGVDDYGQITIPAGLSDVVEVATGGYHSLAVKSDGTVVTWGRMLSGTLDVPAGLSDVLDVAAGFSDLSMALKSDGTVVAWGGNAYGRTTVPTGLDNVVEIAAGTHHCLALKSDGTVVAWGRDNNGQATVPPGLDDAVSIAAGLNHSLALRSNGTVVAWGWDTYQQSTVPAGLDDVVAIGAGYAHSFALKSDGTLVGWGNFNPGKMEPPPEVVEPERFAGGLGHGLAVLSMSDAPILLEDSMIVAPFNQPHSYQVAASGNNLEFSAMNLPVGLSIDSATGIISGTATEQGFGYARIAVQNGAGRDVKILPVNVGSGDAPTDITLNSNAIEENNASGNVVGTLGAIDPDVGDTFTFAVVGGLDAGQFEAVGDELRTTGGGLDLEAKQFHEVILRVTDSGNYVFEETFMIEALDDAGEDFDGDGLTQTEEAALGTSDLISDWDGDGSGDGAEVAAGTDPLDPSEFADGTVFGWGDNELGQIAVPGDLWGVVEVSSIWNHSLALKSDGTVVGWGVDDYGQITIPAGLSDVVEVATGGYHSLAVKSDGTVVTWGRMLSGTLDVPAGLSDVLDVAAGFSDLSMALKSDGTVVAWGGNAYGRTTVPTGLDNVVEIAAGTHHCLALKSDGTVVAWGRDNNGQATVPPGLDDAVSIAAGLNHSLALRSNGTVVAWGWDTYQQSTVPAGLNDVVAIGAGYAHSFALKSDGTLVGWGNFNPGKMEPPPEVVEPETFAGGLGHGLAVLSMSDAPILLEDSMIVAPFNQPHSYQVAASGNNLEFSAMNLPVGLSIDSATGIISGTATEQGFGYARIAVQNGAGRDVKTLPVNVGGFFPNSPIMTLTTGDTFSVNRGPFNGGEITHFRIVDVDGVDLTLVNGSVPISVGDWITVADGDLGVRFSALPGTTRRTVTAVSAFAENESSTGSASATIDLNPIPGAVTLSLDSHSYQSSEGNLLTLTGSSVPALVVNIVKSGSETGQFSVDVELIPGTALPDDGDLGNGIEDYRVPSVSTVTLNESDAAKGYYIELIDDMATEDEETFTVRVSNPTNGAILGAITQATVTIIDDEQAVSELTTVDPDPIPGGGTGTLQVHLAPAAANGKWRLLTESLWRDSGDSIPGLVPGQYAVEFKPVPGFDHPLPITMTVAEDPDVVPLIEFYASNSNPVNTGAITVNLSGGTGKWRLRGENDNSWNDPGVTLSNLLPGIYALEFEPLTGFDAPLARQVQIVGGQTLVVDEGYTAETAFGNSTPQPLSLSQTTTAAPYQWNGQIQTVLGTASGVAVSEHVVLTSASALYDDHNFRYVTGVQWQFQKQGDDHNPVPLTPRGWQVIGQGYAAEFDKQREVENDPGTHGNRSRELDVAAMYFLTPVARGGSGGYLVDNTSANPWLTDAGRSRFMSGYPVAGAAGLEHGKLHATAAATDIDFTHVQGPVFTTTDLQDLPGMTGAPVYAQHGNGNYYPAAIVLGGYDEMIVRAIDNSVVFLIRLAEILGDTGQDSQTRGTVPHVTVERMPTGEVEVDGNLLSARWKLRNLATGASTGEFPFKYSYRSGAGNFAVVFTEEEDWIKPNDEPLSLAEEEGANVYAQYAIDPAGVETASLAEWQSLFGIVDLFDDSDGDGVEALEEYAFNLLPDRPDYHGLERQSGTSGLPYLGLIEDGGAYRLVVEYLRRKDESINYTVEFSNDLENWIPAAGVEEVTDLGDYWERVVIEDTVTSVQEPRRFARVRVSE